MNFPTVSFAYLLLSSCLLVGISGCGQPKSAPDKSIVSGVVTFDGQPIVSGLIMFHPTGNTKGPVSGASVVNGMYIVKNKGGIPHGTHWVEIRTIMSGTADQSSKQFLPAKFNDQSTLTAEITADTETLDFVLTSH